MKSLRSGLQRLRSQSLKLDQKPVEEPDSKQQEGIRAVGGGYLSADASPQSSDWQPLQLTLNEAFDQARPAWLSVPLG